MIKLCGGSDATDNIRGRDGFSVSRTLVLAVDRDDDYGVKGRIATPVVGMDAAREAVLALGTVDPEDSDVNALLAAMNICEELRADGKDVEIALISGDQKVGHRSDSALVDELTQVIADVAPTRAILVGDGAEDEYIYPIISSRVPIDSVKRVYVKQAPGVEGTLYIVSKMLADPAKKKRFLAPIGGLLMLISSIYLVQGLYAFAVTGEQSYVFSLAAPIVVFLLGLMVTFYAFEAMDRVAASVSGWLKRLHSGNILVSFTVLSVACIAIGLVLGGYSVKTILDNSPTYITLTFATNAMWPVAIGLVLYELGKAMDGYISETKVALSTLISSTSLVGLAFIVQGVLDFLRNYLGYGSVDGYMVVAEFVAGVLFSVVASMLQASFQKYLSRLEDADASRGLVPGLRGGAGRHGVQPDGGRGLREAAAGADAQLRPGFRGRGRRAVRRGGDGLRRRGAPRPGHRGEGLLGHAGLRRLRHGAGDGRGHPAGRGGHRPGRGRGRPGGGVPPGGAGGRPRPRGQRGPDHAARQGLHRQADDNHAVRSGQRDLRLRWVHRRRPGGLHGGALRREEDPPPGVRLRASGAQGGHRPRGEGEEAPLGRAHNRDVRRRDRNATAATTATRASHPAVVIADAAPSTARSLLRSDTPSFSRTKSRPPANSGPPSKGMDGSALDTASTMFSQNVQNSSWAAVQNAPSSIHSQQYHHWVPSCTGE